MPVLYPQNESQNLIKACEDCFNSPERVNAERMWTEITEYTMPNQFGVYRYAQLTPGTKTTNRVFDTCAIKANYTLASIIGFLLTGPASKWASLKVQNKRLAKDQRIKVWMENVNDTIQEEINNSNFGAESGQFYEFYVGLGSGVLRVEEEESDGLTYKGLKFKSQHLANIAWTRDIDGRVYEVYRKFELTALQAYLKWKERLPKEIQEAYKDSPYKKYWFYNIICKRDEDKIQYNEGGLAAPQKRPYRNIYIAACGGEILEEGGYYELPDIVSVMERLPNEEYGRGRGHYAIPDVKSVNRYVEVDLTARSFAAQPPIIAKQRNVIGVLKYQPGQIWEVRDADPMNLRPWESGSHFDVNNDGIERLHKSIESIYFLDRLLMPDREKAGGMDIAEMAERRIDLQRILGPINGRIEKEFITPIVSRIFNILDRKNMFDTKENPMPDVIKKLKQQGQLRLKVESGASISYAQNLEAISSIGQLMQYGAVFAQMGRPEALDNINADSAMSVIAKSLNVPDTVLASEEEKQQVRKAREQAMMAQQQAELNVKGADAASKMAKARGLNNNPGGGMAPTGGAFGQ